MNDYKLFNCDWLELCKSLPDKSIDAIITDLPYGTTACSWDEIIPFAPMWEQVNRINKGAFVTTASQPFTSKLIMSNVEQFKYEWIWKKTKPSNFLNARNKPMPIHENIVVFSQQTIANGSRNKMTYNPIMTKGMAYKKVQRTDRARS